MEKPIARPPTAKPVTNTDWYNESCFARTADLMLLEELIPDWTHLFELNTREQLDAGKAPVQEDVMGRCKGKCTQRCFNLFNNSKLEIDQLDTGDDKCDNINIMIGEPDEIECAQPAPSLEHLDAAIHKVLFPQHIVCLLSALSNPSLCRCFVLRSRS